MRTRHGRREQMALSLLRVSTAAERFGVHPSTVRNWVAKGYIHAVRLPSGHRRIPESEVTRLLGELFHLPSLGEEAAEKPLQLGEREDNWGRAV
jgi:excisionase family DNA binding protein